MTEPGSIWDDVVGQPAAVRQLRDAAARGPVHAYLFVGPSGSTKLEAARAFAAQVMSGGEDRDQRDARLVLGGVHPDVREVRRVGASILRDQAQEVVRLASLAPTEGDRKVMILDEFHLLEQAAAVRLMKTVEEPPPSTMFVILCEFVPVPLVTIASRSVRIDFRSIDTDVIAQRLVAEGIGAEAASIAATAALGDLDRARVLASDEQLAARRAAFAHVPHQLNGTGAVAIRTAAMLLDMIDAAAEPLTARHEQEIVALDEQIARYGEKGSGRKQLEERHKRELRRYRTDELRAGLATLAATYRDSLTAPGSIADVDSCARAVSLIHDSLESLERNPNERLLVENLLWSLPDAQGVS